MPNKSSLHGAPFSPCIISSGTLRLQDLLRAFADEYERLVPFNSARLVREARDAADTYEAHDAATPGIAQAHIDCAHSVLQDLEDALEDVAAREGCYFGASEGDGACFGFWPLENEDCA